MTHPILLALLATLLIGCAPQDPEKKPEKPGVPSPPLISPSAAKIAEAVSFVREGLPFPVEINPFGALDSSLNKSELVNLGSTLKCNMELVSNEAFMWGFVCMSFAGSVV